MARRTPGARTSRRRGVDPKQSWRKKYRQTSPTRARRHIGQDRRQVRADALLIWLAESKERKKGVDNDLQGLSEPTPSVTSLLPDETDLGCHPFSRVNFGVMN